MLVKFFTHESKEGLLTLLAPLMDVIYGAIRNVLLHTFNCFCLTVVGVAKSTFSWLLDAGFVIIVRRCQGVDHACQTLLIKLLNCIRLDSHPVSWPISSGLVAFKPFAFIVLKLTIGASSPVFGQFDELLL